MKIKGIIFILLACFFWGTVGVFNNSLTKCGYDSVSLASIRCIISAITLWIYIAFKNEKNVKISFKQLLSVGGEGVSFYIMAVLYFISIVKTSPATASVLITTAPIMVVVFSVIFWKEKLTLNKILAIVFSIIGCALISGLINQAKFNLFGIFAGFLAAFAYAAYSIFTKISLKQKTDSEANIAYSFLFSALAALVYKNPIDLFQKVVSSSLNEIFLLLGMSLVTGALAGLMYTKGMKILPAGMAACFAGVEPLISTTLSVVFLGEKLKFDAVIGIVLILTAVTILSIKTKNEGKKINV